MFFFNGFTLLLMVLSFMGGVAWLHSLDKAIAKSDARKRANAEARANAHKRYSENDTPIYDYLAEQHKNLFD